MIIGITGAHGFMGSHLYECMKTICECEVFDRQKYNLFDIESMKQFVENKDFIFHLAGANRASNEELLKVNALGTLNLLEAIRKYSQAETKIVFASSLQVYGFTHNLIYLKENNPPKPNNIYGLSKKFAEEIINRYSEYYGIKGLIFRISNIYGKGCRPYYNSAIATFIDLIQKREKIIINGSGEQARDFIYVSDVVNAFSKSLNYHFKHTETLNICTGKPVSINEAISTLKKVIDMTIEVEYRKSDDQVNFLIGDSSKAMEVLEYKPEIGLEDGLTKTIENKGSSKK